MPTDSFSTLAAQLSAVMDGQTQHLEDAVSRGIDLLDQRYGGFLAEAPDATYEPSLTASTGDLLQELREATLAEFGA
ncbi:MAG: hypothetical protein JO171_17765 [Paludibacterium sp.]|uniref:hypothetical protein n=1 Tax=Paludibacterium sp. TaxID=1917523 RepID=UPI0025D6611D|nr:hypothetical protein [Paludibacterium sp.]MBV8049001.1 hypothetical protein [Paludibacterium sp.]MBV8647482.1 hypothetical protein [Paludibacterium sp.]